MIRLKASALDDARRLLGVSSDERLAAQIEMSSTAIRNLRAGRSAPSVGTLVKLRKVTGIPFEALIVETEEMAA